MITNVVPLPPDIIENFSPVVLGNNEQELPEELQKHIYFEFGSIEDHFKYRQAVMEAYPCGHYPVFEGYNHMQYQIRDPKGFAEMLAHIAERDCMPELPFIRK